MSASFRPRSNLAFKLGLALGFLSLVGALNAWVMDRVTAELSGMANTINVAGRLRMLSQKALVGAFLTDAGMAEEMRMLEKTVADFEEGLNAIENGGYAYGIHVRRPPGNLESQFELVRTSWLRYRDELFRYLRSDRLKNSASEQAPVLVGSKQVLDNVESLISMSSNAVQEREVAGHQLLNAIFIIDLICLLLFFTYIRQRIIRPIRELENLSEEFGAGQYYRRSQHVGQDEIGRLAHAFNKMADNLARNIDSIAVNAQRDRDALLNAKKLSQVIEHSPVSVLITDPEGIVEYVNPCFTEVSGYSQEEVLGQPTSILKSGATPAAVYKDLWRTIRSSRPWKGNLLNRKKNGDLFWESTRISPLLDENNNILNYVVVKEDITEQKAAEKTLRLQQRAVEASSNGIVMIDAESDACAVIYTNPAFTRITGYHGTEVIGTQAASLLGFDDEKSLNEQALALLQHDNAHVWIAPAKHKTGQSFWCEYALAPVRNEDRAITHYVATVSDVTERVNYEQRLTDQATHDALTGLANRTLFADRASQAISQSERYGQQVAIVLIDLDHFKYINDTLGHAVGDQLLRVVAKRLTDCLRSIDTIARMGGDEFALILTQLNAPNEAEAVLKRIVDSLASPYFLEAHESHISCSAGVSFYPKDGLNADDLLKNADTAMYQAKASGRNTYQLYGAAMYERLSQRVSLETQLRHALERDELFLQYQPQIDLKSRAIIGVEALIRWEHPDLGCIPPKQFISLAEEIGLILPIGEWVLQTACEQASAWNADSVSPLRVAINLSVHQLQHKSLESVCDRVLQLSALDPSCLEIEIAESVIVNDADAVIRFLLKLKDRGISIALDDFGAGYSSLSYLKRLPIDALKIDQSFVRGIDVDRHDAALTRTVIALASNLGLKTVGEGVEVEAQANLLTEWGCNSAQGFLFHHPVSAAEITQLLTKNRVFAADKQQEKFI